MRKGSCAIALSTALLIGAPASAQEAQDVTAQEATTYSGVGLGATANTGDASIGLTLPLYAAESFRLEPTLLFGYDAAMPAGLPNTTYSSTNLGLGMGAIYGLGSGSARGLVGAEVGGIFHVRGSTTVVDDQGNQTEVGDDSELSGVTTFVRPVFGGELSVTDHVVIGLRAGPSFEYFLQDSESGRPAAGSIGGYGRLDAVYYF